MDLIYEQSADSKVNGSQETLKVNPDESSSEINKKTEESFGKLEKEISKTYENLETKASTWGASFGSFISNFKVNDYISETRKQVENLHLDERVKLTKSTVTKKFDEIQQKIVNEDNAEKSKNMWSMLSTKTNTYLDELDKELEQVETFAGSYVNKFGQFIKDTIVVAAPEDRDELIDDDESDLLFNVVGNVPKGKPQKVTSTRTEAQLYALHTSPELFLTTAEDKNFDDFKKSFKLGSKTEEISGLLKKNAELSKLSTKIVPEKVTYEEFWTRYFYLYDKILKEEVNRKELLKKGNETTDTKAENVEWSDDEDANEDNNKNKHEKSTTSSEGTYELNSVNSSTLDVTKEPKDTEAKKDFASTDQGDEEDDDDWE